MTTVKGSGSFKASKVYLEYGRENIRVSVVEENKDESDEREIQQSIIKTERYLRLLVSYSP